MEKYVNGFPFLFFFFFLVHSALSQLPLEQRTAMVNLASSVNSSLWNTTDADPCNWNGVSCTANSVTHLSFSGFQLLNNSFVVDLCLINSLESLDLSNNYLASIPSGFLTGCGINGLKMVNFSRNGLTGFLPSFQEFGSLESLDLSFNFLAGTVVSQFEELIELRSLNLSFNWLNGSVPTKLGKGMVLEKLYLSNNMFTGEIPETLFEYANLTDLDLSVNNVSGSIPGRIEKLSKLETLVLSSNHLSGEIPQNLSRIKTLYRFAANQNGFVGTIPQGISSYLKVLDLSFNQLRGLIPLDFLSPANLYTVDLTNNSLFGPIPVNISKSLFRLRLGSNFLNGTIPSEIGELLNLVYLEIDGNRLTGAIPPELQTAKLELLNLAQNNLQGQVPARLGDLAQLTVVRLDQNNLSGVIPNELSQLKKLLILNLSHNSFSGAIPSSISSLQSLSRLNLEDNKFTGSIPDTFSDFNHLMQLELGNNQLSGRIPTMPSSLQISLNLSRNHFEGPIPSTLARLTNLEVLDLSSNGFTGEVPKFLITMQSLTVLVLSNNRLSGTLPQFPHWVSVNATGNKDLNPIPPSPNPNLNPNSPTNSQKKGSPTALLIAIGVAGAVIAVGLATILVLIFKRFYNINAEIHESGEHIIPQVIDGNLITTSSIHRSNINFTTAMEAVTNPANVMLKNKFSTYYKAAMPSGMNYCMKKLNWSDKIFQLGSHGRFGRELEILGRLSNSNVMIPLAYVLTEDSAYLFYEYSQKGTLYDFLYSSSGSLLDWSSRYNIALGVSQGLDFLHGCANPILHLDISTRNVFLKSLSDPQIGDIELCKVIDPSKSTGSLSTVAGSVGYIPPEYAYTMRVTMPGNVYSFGVILLELVTGKPAVSEGIELAKWVLGASSRNDSWDQILDPRISKASIPVRNQMLSVLKVAQACVSLTPEARPKMKSVARMLVNVR